MRTGFYEYEDFVKLRDALPEYFRSVFLMGYFTGMREGEIVGLTCAKVNLFARKITLHQSDTKNGEPRIIYLLEEELFEAIKAAKILHDRRYPDCPYVFFKDGKRITDFRPDWDRALRKCGYPIMFKCEDCRQPVELPVGMSRKNLSARLARPHKETKLYHEGASAEAWKQRQSEG